MEPNNMDMNVDKKSNGALVGAVIVVLILILGGVYLWSSNSLNNDESNPVEYENTEEQSGMEESNAASVIEADLSVIEEENNSADTDFTADVNAVQ